MSFKLPKIYPITDVRLSGLSHAEQVEKLIAGGAKIIQLREKYASPQDFYESAKKALKIAQRRNVKLIINDRVDIALALKADGVHLGQDDLPPLQARKILGEKAIIGFSTHNIEQAISAAELPINYLAVGPVFHTKTKENPDEIVGIETIEIMREAIGNFPFVAIGGITAANFLDVLNAGANSVALISELLGDAENITDKIRQLIDMCKTN